MNRPLQIIALLIVVSTGQIYSQTRFDIKGRVLSSISREPIEYATVFVKGAPEYYSVSDTTGYFVIKSVPPGIIRVESSSVGYLNEISPEYLLSSSALFIELHMDEDISMLDGVTVRSSVLERSKDAGVGKQIIGAGDIEKMPGGNRDISRVVRSYPGVSYSPIGYRNDLIVRGGGPSENAFYIDGIEIPNINHFSTQGASGGPVGIINADLIEQVQFYTGALPVQYASVLSSIMDIRLKNGDPYSNNFKVTVGASEFGISGSGHIGKKTTYLFSARQSYLQLLFKLLGLPFLPNYIDGQFKLKHRLSEKDEITFIALGGIDRMRLNTEEKGEEVEYMLSYLPVIRQNCITVGASYIHYGKRNRLNIVLSYNNLYNSNIKYLNNDSSNPDNLMYDIRSNEEKLIFRIEDEVNRGCWKILSGINSNLSGYDNATNGNSSDVRLRFFNYSLYFSTSYASLNKKLFARIGIKADGSTYSSKLMKFWNHLSPRATVSYTPLPQLSLNISSGIYFQMPPLTSLAYKEDGLYTNSGLDYMMVYENSLGLKWNISEQIALSAEGFYKIYKDMPVSVDDGIPLSCKGNDYGIVGNEKLESRGKGRTYGIELSARWQIAGKLNLIGSATLYNSEYKDYGGEYFPSAWDNKFIINLGATYNCKRNWDIGAKLSSIGGAPYTPFDIAKSSLKLNWDKTGKAYYDYRLYNTLRLEPFAQLDVRVDKSFYFKKWMLALYVDLQNITSFKLKQQDALMSTGIIENPNSGLDEQRYIMKNIPQKAGSIVPTLGITVGF